MNFNDDRTNIIRLDEKIEGKRQGEKNTQNSPNTRVISFSSGKGGVGKTNIVANLGYVMSRAGKKVLLFDADLGLGNIDILLGLTPKYNLSHVIAGEKTIKDIIVNGPGNLKIIPASSGVQELTELSKRKQLSILKSLDEILNEFDIFLIDTAAGISSNVLHFNAAAQEVMIIVSPEPTSITDAYALMKVLSFRYEVRQFNLIVNTVKTEDEGKDVHMQLQMVADRFLSVNIDYMGCVLTDENITKGVRRQKLVSELFPDSPSSHCFRSLASSLETFSSAKNTVSSSNFRWKKLFRL
jgi:flagellar biosynthesis protein FlhG